jgi:uncharacterized membrane protein YbaN (DUF454 family)
MQPEAVPPGRWARWRRAALTLAGLLSLALGLLGVVLPGLPTTPLVLLAAWCFAQASPHLHAWLRQQRYLGALVRDWEAQRSLSLRVKWWACTLMLLMVALSLWQLQHWPWLAALVALAALLGCVVVWRLPTRR